MSFLIPIAYINEACFVSQNIDEKKMKANIEEAQADLKDILGPEFYDQIVTQYENETLTSANDTLYEDYIKQFLAWQSAYYSLGFSQADSTPTGVREFNDENSTILSDLKLHAFEKNVKRRATRYKYDLINYLKQSQDNDSTAFPLWEETCEEEFGFGITAVSRGDNSNEILSVNKAILNNENGND